MVSVMYIKNSKSKNNKRVKRGRKGKDCMHYNKEKKTCNRTKSFVNQMDVSTLKLKKKSVNQKETTYLYHYHNKLERMSAPMNILQLVKI